MARFTRRQSLIATAAALAVVTAGYLVYKTFPHLSTDEDELHEAKKDEVKEEQENKQDIQ